MFDNTSSNRARSNKYRTAYSTRGISLTSPQLTIVQTEKNAQAGLSEDCVCRLEKDVIAGDIPT